MRAIGFPRLGILAAESNLWEIHPILGWIEFGMGILGLVLLLHMLVLVVAFLWMVQAYGLSRTKEMWRQEDNQ